MLKLLSIVAAVVILATGTAGAQPLDAINPDYLSIAFEGELQAFEQMLFWLLIVAAAMPVCLCGIALTLEEESENAIS